MNKTKIFILSALFLVFALSAQTLVKTKAGILVSSGKELMKLKSNSVLKADDKYRILLKPDSGGYGYFVMVTGSTAKLLASGRAYKDQILAYPGNGDFMKAPGKGSHNIHLLFSLKKLTEIENLFKSKTEVKADAFNNVLKKLKKNKQSVVDDSQVDISIAGNVRGEADKRDKEFLQKLKPFATKDVLMLDYSIKVK